MSAPERVVVVGAGVAGLTAAYRIVQAAPGTEVTVLDAGDRIGGKIATSPFAGLPAVDEAADAFLARVPAAVDLCGELGLADALVTPAQRSAYVWSRGSLRRFPEGLVLGVPTDLDALRTSGVVSAAGVERAALDLTMPAGEDEADRNRGRDRDRATADESVGALVRRRVGDEVFEALVAPLLSGVNAGDADELSVELGAPQLAAAVRDQPSLIEGLRAQRAAADPANADAPIFFGLRDGTATLTAALAAHLPAGAVRTASPVTALQPLAGGGFRVIGRAPSDEAWHASSLEADAVVVATPSYVTAELVAPFAAGVAAEMARLEWASVVLVTLAVPRSAIAHPLDGSGFLVAESRDARDPMLMTACSWSSSKWAHLARDDTTILRVSAGRHHDRRALDLDDRALVAQLVEELACTVGMRGEPSAVRVTRWDRALPQFRPGHADRVRAWRAELAEAAPGLAVTGASYLGLGIPACIADAGAAAEIVTDLVVPGRAT